MKNGTGQKENKNDGGKEGKPREGLNSTEGESKKGGIKIRVRDNKQ